MLSVLLVLLGQARIANGQTLTTIHSFTGGSDGGLPQAGLVQGSDGNFYGTTAGFANLGSGSFPGNSGTVFRISSSGIFTNLYSFQAAAMEPVHKPGWSRAATAISTARRANTARAALATTRHSVSDQSERQLHESILVHRR